MGGVDQVLELIGRAVGSFRRVEQNAVVAPVAVAGKFGERHQLDRSHADIRQRLKTLFDLRIASVTASVQFVEHSFVPGTARPIRVAPRIGCRIDDYARVVHIGRLCAGRGVGHLKFIVDEETVLRAGADICLDAVPAVFTFLHWQRSAANDHQADALRVRCPEPEPSTGFFQ